MLMSQKELFAFDQAITATAISENVIQLNDAGTVHGEGAAIARNFGKGTPIKIHVQATEAFTTLTSLTVTVETSAAAALTSSTVLYSSGAIVAADLVAGYEFTLDKLPDAELLDFIGLRFTVGGSNAGSGKITAGYVQDK